MRIYNKGKSTARNVRLIIKDEPGYLYATNPFSFPMLHEGEYVNLNIELHKGLPDVISFEILWDDEYKENNSHAQTVNLN